MDEKLKSSRTEKDLLKLIIENAELRQRLREYEGVSVGYDVNVSPVVPLEHPLTTSLPVMYTNLLNTTGSNEIHENNT